jgi:hypothetical protein
MHFGKTLIPPLMEYLNQHFLRIIKNDNSSVGLPIFIILCYEVTLTANVKVTCIHNFQIA